LLAGLHLDETTVVVEHAKTRNHTEKLLGLRVEEKDDYREVFVSKENYPTPKEYFVPSDISSAAFFIVLTLLSKNSELLLKNVLLNDTRTGVLKVLLEMGGNIVIQNEQESNGEIFGDLLVSSSKLHNINISPSLIPNLIDEIPILSIAGIFSNEIFSIRDAKELRFKESDRINALCSNFRKLGLECEEYEDGFDLSGEIKNENQIIESFGDHRIAMAFSILALITDKKIRINDFECVAISNPSFLDQIKSITL
ncbi:MAG: 3-phosphoshikimate 1-carboxyvinyltransferase, partial [Melioribacteraceae bacterium]|nr:3-phosphoshikimate 1-carboxyvinyltransferase [Melioribacteraceae bacterium]